MNNVVNYIYVYIYIYIYKVSAFSEMYNVALKL